MKKDNNSLAMIDIALALCATEIALGGPGSGNWAHVGRPGKRGGSQSRSGGMSIAKGRDWLQRYEAATGKKHSFNESQINAQMTARYETVKKEIERIELRKKEIDKALRESKKNGNAIMKEAARERDWDRYYDEETRMYKFASASKKEKRALEKQLYALRIEKLDIENEIGLDREARPVSDSLVLPKSGKYKGVYREALSTIDSVHNDGVLESIPLKTMTSSKYGGLYKSRGVLAHEIAIDGQSKRKESNLAHEVGHWLDHQALGQSGTFLSESLRGNSSREGVAMRKVIDRLNNSRQISILRNMRVNPSEYKTEIETTTGTRTRVPHIGTLNYYLSNKEMWARAYAQYIAFRSGDEKMIVQISRTMESNDPVYNLSQWPPGDFEPIAEAIDELMEVKGWLR